MPWPPNNPKQIEWPTTQGTVIISAFSTPEHIAALEFVQEYTKYARYRSIVSQKETLIRAASQPDSNVSLAFTPKGKIVGFGILEYPPSEERWHRVGERMMMEISVVEVGRPWRALGLSKKILECLMAHPSREEKILYMVGYSWTWDLEKIPVMVYRDLLVHLFSAQGFQTFQTNDPNIMMRPENLFMARIGAHVPEETKERFRRVRFDLDRYG